jgi:hypothetical protein
LFQAFGFKDLADGGRRTGKFFDTLLTSMDKKPPTDYKTGKYQIRSPDSLWQESLESRLDHFDASINKEIGNQAVKEALNKSPLARR